MSAFCMPALGADMESGVLLEWYVEPGAEVHRGDIIAVVDTDKAEIEIEAFEDGVIDDLCATDTRVPVGGKLATITPVGEVAAESTPAEQRASALHERPRVSPLARRAAAAQHVDLSSLHGSGTDAAIILADVERAAAALGPARAGSDGGAVTVDRQPVAELAVPVAEPAVPVAEPAAPVAEPAVRSPEPSGSTGERDGMRRTTGLLMARSKREIPHFYVEQTLDLAHAMGQLDRCNAGRPTGERILPAALLLAAVAQAAREVPGLNGHVRDDAVELATDVNVGVAIALRGGGLVAPALLAADTLTLDETMRGLSDLAARAKRGVLRARETTEGTITVTNLGDRGADKVLGVIHPPQIAVVGFGAIRDRVVAVDGMVAVRPTVIATVSADHRATDGYGASRLLSHIDESLQRLEIL